MPFKLPAGAPALGIPAPPPPAAAPLMPAAAVSGIPALPAVLVPAPPLAAAGAPAAAGLPASVGDTLAPALPDAVVPALASLPAWPSTFALRSLTSPRKAPEVADETIANVLARARRCGLFARGGSAVRSTLRSFGECLVS